MDLAEIGLKADSTEITQASTALDTFAGKAEKAEKASDKLADAAKDSSKHVDKLGDSSKNAASALRLIGVAAGAAIATFAGFFTVTKVVESFLEQTKEGEVLQRQLAAALKSTGGASGQTIASLEKQADALSQVSIYSTSAAEAAQSVLLTFTNIGGDVFPKATQAAADLASRFGTDLPAAAQQVGRALNNPLQGLQSLRRAGIQFSDSQQAAIKSMVDVNNVAGAQAIILDKLTTSFGGSAAAARDTLGGALKALGNAWDNLFQLSGPAVDTLRSAIEGLVKAISDPSFVLFAQEVGVAIFTAITGLAHVLSGLVDIISYIPGGLEFLAPLFIATFGGASLAAVYALTTAIAGPLMAAVGGLFTLLLANPITAILVAIGAVVLATVNWSKVLSGIITLYGKIVQAAGVVANLFSAGSGDSMVSRGLEIQLNADKAVEQLKDYATDFAGKTKDALTTGGNAAGSLIHDHMVKGGQDAGKQIGQATGQEIELAYAKLNGLVIKPLGDTLVDGGKFIYNQVTGSITKVAADTKDAITDGGTTAGDQMKSSIVSGGQSAASSLVQAGTQISQNMADIIQGAGSNLLQSLDMQMRAAMNILNQQVADVNLTNAQAIEAGANARAAIRKAADDHLAAINAGGRTSGASGGGGYSDSSSTFLDKTSAAALGLDPSGINESKPNNFWLPPSTGGVGFARGGDFTVPGSGNSDRTPVGFWATPGENVKISPAGKAEKPEIKLTIENRMDPTGALDALNTFDGNQRVVNIIASNREAIQNLLGIA